MKPVCRTIMEDLLHINNFLQHCFKLFLMQKNNVSTKASPNKILIITCVVATGFIIGLWIWKSVQIANLRKQSATEMHLLKYDVTNQMRKSDEQHLRSIAKPLVWIVRSEMLKNNMSQVILYTNEMVKEKNFLKIVITNDKGIVLLSTNKKEEGKEFISTGKVNYLLADTTAVENMNDSLLIMSSPVMGFNNRLGTLIVNYSVQHPQF